MPTVRLEIAVAFALSLAPFSAAFADENPQVSEAPKLYGKFRANCHGDAGQGGDKAPPLVGAKALPLDPPAGAKFRKGQFHTAKDVLDWASKHMPAKKPGSLKKAQYEAIVAFDLKANGIDMTGKHLDEKTAAGFVLHP